jgi:hypothetical protein
MRSTFDRSYAVKSHLHPFPAARDPPPQASFFQQKPGQSRVNDAIPDQEQIAILLNGPRNATSLGCGEQMVSAVATLQVSKRLRGSKTHLSFSGRIGASRLNTRSRLSDLGAFSRHFLSHMHTLWMPTRAQACACSAVATNDQKSIQRCGE